MSRFAAFVLAMIAVGLATNTAIGAKPKKPEKPLKPITGSPTVDGIIYSYRSRLKESPPPGPLAPMGGFRRKGFHIEAASLVLEKERVQVVVISKEAKLPDNAFCVMLSPDSRAKLISPDDVPNAPLTDIAFSSEGAFELIPIKRLTVKTPDHVSVFEGTYQGMVGKYDLALRGFRQYVAIQICMPPVQKAASHVLCVQQSEHHLVRLPDGVALGNAGVNPAGTGKRKAAKP